MGTQLKAVLLLLLLVNIVPAQDAKKVTVVPEPGFEAGAVYTFFFGTHWRSLWTAPLEVEVLDLDNFAGGLTPIKKGGGQQTKSLRFKGADGRIWKFRSMTKDPAKVLPPELRESLVADVLKDQISSANPLAPLVVAPILEAAGVLQSEPQLCLMPDSEKLGEFREEFAGLIGMIEIHPDEEFIKKDPMFDNSDKFKGTLKLLEDLETKRSNKFDAKAFLKARLLDCYLGDWDRHTDQWRWARFEEGDTTFWRPIPRDRDQAFAKFTGLGPSLAEYYVPQLTHFGDKMPPVKKITWSGRYLDRRILPALSKAEWDKVTDELLAVLSDSFINKAVARLPEPHYSIASGELISKLLSRRNGLKEFSEEYYLYLNDVADIFCSDEDDYVKISFPSAKETKVEVFKHKNKDNTPKGEPLFSRVFDNNTTSELRIYLGAEDDYCIAEGSADNIPQIRIIGGDGKDIVANNSEAELEFYDSGKKAEISGTGNIFFDDTKWPVPDSVELRYQPPLRDRGSDWLFKPIVSANDDDGLVLGLGLNHYKYDFRSDPNQYQMFFETKYATKPESYSFLWEAKFYKLLKFAVPDVSFERTKLKLTQFYGIGNETDYSHELEENDYYRLEYEFHSVNIGLNFKPSKKMKFRLGFSYHFSEMELENMVLLNNFKHNTYGLGDIHSINFNGHFAFDNRDNKEQASSGFYAAIGAAAYPKTRDIVENYYTGFFDLRGYIPFSSKDYHVLALRAGGSRVTGIYPFYSAAMVGGEYSLRGYNRERFAGDSALFFQTEIRNYVTPIKIIIKGNLGTYFFAETGRVYTNLHSTKWHSSFGGGVWASFLDRMLVLRLSLAGSEETLVYYINTGMAF